MKGRGGKEWRRDDDFLLPSKISAQNGLRSGWREDDRWEDIKISFYFDK